MGGTIRGKVEAFISGGSTSNTTEGCFKNIYDVFSAHPNMTEVARNNGNAGTGTGYWDSGSPFGTNAFFVFKMKTSAARQWPYYILVQWMGTATFGNSPGNPGLVDDSGGNSGLIGFQFVIGVRGDENPWNGTTTLGSSTKGATVWKVPTNGTKVLVFPRSNNPGGKHDSLKQNCMSGNRNSSGVTQRQQIIMDDDSFIMLTDNNNNNTYDIIYGGLYTPKTGLTISYPFVAFSSGFNNDLPLLTGNFTAGQSAIPTNNYGALGGAGGGSVNSNPGGIMYATDGYTNNDGYNYDVKGFVFGRYDEFMTTTMQPNKYFSPNSFDEFPVNLIAYETNAVILSTGGSSLVPSIQGGYAGECQLLKETFNMAIGDRNADGYRAAFGASATANTKVTVPWPSNVTPLGGAARTGTNFSF